MSEAIPPIPEHPSHARKGKAKKRLIIIAVVIVVLGAGYWYIKNAYSLPFQSFVSLGSSLETSVAGQLSNTFSAPPPLREPVKTAPKGKTALTRAGVIADTNIQRADNGNLPALAEDATLDDIATLRLDDMFQNQYFAHVSPSSSSAETVASSVGYSYLALGENLALGNFTGDADVVTAWMNSPGHRANILDVHYTEIGVAVRQGVFQGETTWIAVQIFGRPSSDCPNASAALKASIDNAENQITVLDAGLTSKKAAIDAMQPQSGDEYNQAVGEYNTLVAQYNALVANTKAAIAQYNGQVQSFNSCIGA